MWVNIFLAKNQQRNCIIVIFESVRLEAFSKFKDTKDALAATSSLIEGKLPKKLKKFLEKNIISKEV
jgi:hypothetical protein